MTTQSDSHVLTTATHTDSDLITCLSSAHAQTDQAATACEAVTVVARGIIGQQSDGRIDSV